MNKYNISLVWSNDYTVRTFFKLFENRKTILYTRHYVDRIMLRGCKIPSIYELQKGKVVQVEIENNDISKATIRTKADDGHSEICTTVSFKNGMIVYMTAYKNNINDKHCSLNEADYSKELVKIEE